MRSATRISSVVAASCAAVLLGAPAALAQTVTDPYTGVKGETLTRTPPGSGVSATGVSSSGTGTSPSTLPFTGGELVLTAAAGAAAVGGGVLLVVSGRRRRAEA